MSFGAVAVPCTVASFYTSEFLVTTSNVGISPSVLSSKMSVCIFILYFNVSCSALQQQSV